MASDSTGGGGVDVLQIDETYEFCAPRFFDFNNEETDDEVRKAELWFETSLSYAPSPFMPKIKEGRSVKIDSVCDFGNVDMTQKESDKQMNAVDNTTGGRPLDIATDNIGGQQQEAKDGKSSFEFVPEVKPNETDRIVPSQCTDQTKDVSAFEFPVQSSSNGMEVPDIEAFTPKTKRISVKGLAHASVRNQAVEVCTPETQQNLANGAAAAISKHMTAKKIASMVKQASTLKQKTKSPTVQSSKSTKPKNVKCPSSIIGKNAMATDVAHENQAVKRQKLDEGRSRQILNVKNRMLPHKSRLGLPAGTDMLPSAAKGYQEDSHLLKEVTPFVSAAEMVKKFESRTRDVEISQEDTASMIQRRPRLMLTRPKEPELQTAQRVRAVRVKSSAELEAEMLAKIPKFKARPFNKKILEAPSLPALPRSTPQPPVFQEFHFKTVERANRHDETSSVVSSLDISQKNQSKPLKLTEPRPPQLETALRARPLKVKSSQELELEELEKAPKFKARPLNRKILESKGEIGLSSHPKPQITTPQEFHFATNERLGAPASVADLFDKLSLHSESSSRYDKNELPRITIPDPFHLHTEERGHEKERQLAMQLLQRQLEEEKSRIPKANPYPYTTDYPVVPPKPVPKPCTRPEGFQLESLVRHEEEMQRKMEEKERMEREEAQRRLFRAQPILKEDPIPLPVRERKPLTEVQEFILHVDHRSVQRSEFDKKMKDKEIKYKRLREESEAAKMIEEEKVVKHLRRTMMVPQARPIPKFDNPFFPQRSTKEATKPQSPELRVNHRGERRRAFHMR